MNFSEYFFNDQQVGKLGFLECFFPRTFRPANVGLEEYIFQDQQIIKNGFLGNFCFKDQQKFKFGF